MSNLSECQPILDQIEASVTDDLAEADALDLRHHLETCESCRAQYELAQRIDSGLKELEPLECPSAVVEAVLRVAEREGSRRPSLTFWQAPLLAAGLAAFALGLFLWSAHEELPTSESAVVAQLSAEELERAELEARWVLAYVASLSERSARLARDETVTTLLGSSQEALERVRGVFRSPFPQPTAAAPKRETADHL